MEPSSFRRHSFRIRSNCVTGGTGCPMFFWRGLFLAGQCGFVRFRGGRFPMPAFRARRFATGLPAALAAVPPVSHARFAARGWRHGCGSRPFGRHPSRGQGLRVRRLTGRDRPDGNVAGSAQSQTLATATDLIAVSTNQGLEDVATCTHARCRAAIRSVAVAACNSPDGSGRGSTAAPDL